MTEAENQRSAAEALESVRQGRSRLAAESSLPWWRHWLIGLLFGVLVGAQGYPLPIPTFGRRRITNGSLSTLKFFLCLSMNTKALQAQWLL